MNLGPVEIGLIRLAVMLLFGYRKLSDASRSLGRSLRIFKGELDGPTPEAPDAEDARASRRVRPRPRESPLAQEAATGP
jgi:sec-independent protein translocase protein TatA